MSSTTVSFVVTVAPGAPAGTSFVICFVGSIDSISDAALFKAEPSKIPAPTSSSICLSIEALRTLYLVLYWATSWTISSALSLLSLVIFSISDKVLFNCLFIDLLECSIESIKKVLLDPNSPAIIFPNAASDKYKGLSLGSKFFVI